MRFFRRGLFGLFLTALTVGLLLVGVYIFQNAQNERESRRGQRTERERSYQRQRLCPSKSAPFPPNSSPLARSFQGRTLELRTAASGALVEMSPNFREGGCCENGASYSLRLIPPAPAQPLHWPKPNSREAEAELSEARDALVLSNDELKAAERQFELRMQAADRQKNLRTRGVGTESALEIRRTIRIQRRNRRPWQTPRRRERKCSYKPRTNGPDASSNQSSPKHSGKLDDPHRSPPLLTAF